MRALLVVTAAGVAAVARPAARGLRAPANWLQLAKFSLVGASGYAVNLFVYGATLQYVGLDYRVAAVCSFLVAVSNNYVLNRAWTFGERKGHFGFQGLRYLVVSVVALGTNLVCLTGLVGAGIGEMPAQAIAIVVVTPVSFLGNKLWSFRRRRPRTTSAA